MQKQLLFIPGPVTVAEPVLAAMARQMIDHRGPEFAKLLARVATGMQPIFGTKNEVVVLGCSGSGGLEAAVANSFTPGEKLLAAPVGVFGERIIAIARTFGMDVEEIVTQPGCAVDPHKIAERLRADRNHEIKGLLFTHNETSTGVQNDMEAIAAAIGDHPALRVVDSVSGLGATEFKMDEWGYDVVVTASQKVLAAPPGAAMIAVSERAWETMAAAGSHRYYMDLGKARQFAKDGQTPWTPPVSIMYALDVALGLYEEEGAPAAWARHERYARAIRAAAEAIGIGVFSVDGAHSVTVAALRAPKDVSVAALRKRMDEQYGIRLGGGQKDLKGKIFRVGTMGDLTQGDIVGMIGSLECALLEEGYELEPGTAVRAALDVFLERSKVPAGV